MTFSATVCDLIVDDLPERHDYDAFKTLFGSDEIIQIVARSDDIFAPDSIDRLRYFSAFACLGVIAMLVAVVTVYPCLLVLAWPALNDGKKSTAVWWFPEAWFDRLVRVIRHHRRTLFSILAILSVPAILGIPRIRVETNPLAYFKDSTPIIRHFHDRYTRLSGSFPLHWHVRSNREDYFQSMDALNELIDYQQFLQTLPGVD